MSTRIKIIASVILLGLTFVAGIVPLFIKKLLSRKLSDSTRVHDYVALLNCFAGGVFLATCFLHLVTESIEQMDELFPDLEYPLCALIIGLGCFSILFLEHAIGHCRRSQTSSSYSISNSKSQMVKDENKPKESYINQSMYTSDLGMYKSMGNTSFSVATPGASNNDTSVVENGNTHASVGVGKGKETGDHNHAKLSVKGEEFNEDEAIALRSLILTIAISVHMVFEGLTIGLQNNDSKIWTLLGALSLHKAIIAFSLGVKICEYCETKRVLFQMMGFSLMTPIGAAVGIGVSSVNEDSRNMTVGILQSFASGVFIYITFFEILGKELVQRYSLLRVSLGLLGYGAVAAMTILHED